jgi:hypothetical protein
LIDKNLQKNEIKKLIEESDDIKMDLDKEQNKTKRIEKQLLFANEV